MRLSAISEEELREFIRSTSELLKNAASASDAVRIIKDSLSQFSPYDIAGIAGTIRREVEKLPAPYKNRYKPFSMDILERYKEIFSKVRPKESIKDKELWESFWNGAEEACFSDAKPKDAPGFSLDNPAGKFFYRLIYGYTMLIADKPGHPVGTPFPGGSTVREKNGEILCPIRDKEKDLPQALCNYCPAKQDPEYK